MEFVSLWDDFHEMSMPIFCVKIRCISSIYLLNQPGMVKVNLCQTVHSIASVQRGSGNTCREEGDNFVKLFLPPFWNGIFSGKGIFSGAHAFVLSRLFRGLGVQEIKEDVKQVSPMQTN